MTLRILVMRPIAVFNSHLRFPTDSVSRLDSNQGVLYIPNTSDASKYYSALIPESVLLL